MTSIINEFLYNIIDNKLSCLNILIDIYSFDNFYRSKTLIINGIHINLIGGDNVCNLNITHLNNFINSLKSSLKLNHSLNELNIEISNLHIIHFKNKTLIAESFISLFSLLSKKHFSKIKLRLNTNFGFEDIILTTRLFKSINNIILSNNNLQVLDLSKNSIEYIYYILTELNNYNLKELIIEYIQSITIDNYNNFRKILEYILNSEVKINTLNFINNNLDDLSIFNSFILNNKYTHNLILDNNFIDKIDKTFLECLKSNNIIQSISLKNNLFDKNENKPSIKIFDTLIEFN